VRVAKIFLMRHAEPETRGVFLGALDVALREPVVGVPPWKGRVVASPLRRALDTARITGGSVEVWEDLREIHYGPWEGLSWSQIEQRFPAEAAAKLADWKGFRLPGAEDWDAFVARIGGAFARLSKERGEVLVVAHLGVNSMLHELATGMPALEFRQDYCEMVEVNL
jgi:alpha-ribazole phosphatase